MENKTAKFGDFKHITNTRRHMEIILVIPKIRKYLILYLFCAVKFSRNRCKNFERFSLQNRLNENWAFRETSDCSTDLTKRVIYENSH